MLHAVFLLVFMLVAAPLLSFIPLAALAGVLAVVCWNMIERPALRAIVSAYNSETLVLLATLAVTLLRDLTAGIIAGCTLAAMLYFIRRASVRVASR
jgi:SulP family sulfate permease